MKKSIFLLTLLLMTLNVSAQTSVTHTIQRGETLEYIAKKYGVSKQAIIDYNKDFEPDVFFIGLSLQIPLPQKEMVLANNESFTAVQSHSYNSIISEADALFTNGKYRKAAKLYTTAIKANPCSDYYYLRGRCYYFQEKYKSAIKDLKVASEGRDLSSNLKRSCIDLLVEAEERREEQLDARYEMWGNIFAATAVTAATVVTAKALDNNTYTNTTTHKSTQGYASNTISLPPELQPEVAARKAVAQINYQMKAEEENFKSNYRANFKRNHGREPSDLEVMEAYTNYLKAKNDAYAATNSTTNSSTSSSLSTNGSSTSTNTRNSNSSTSKDCPSLKINNGKWYCINTGNCGMCGGDGLMDGSFGQGPNSLKCTLCGGSGKCKYCSH